MDIYKYIQTGDNILLKKQYIDFSIYEVEFMENNDILLKPLILISDIIKLKNYDFKKSIVQSCVINNIELTIKLKYNKILHNIYELIGDGTKIIINSNLNIKTIKKNDCGFKYYKNLGISIQSVDAYNCLKEILTQCIANKINILLKIKLENLSIVTVKI